MQGLLNCFLYWWIVRLRLYYSVFIDWNWTSQALFLPYCLCVGARHSIPSDLIYALSISELSGERGIVSDPWPQPYLITVQGTTVISWMSVSMNFLIWAWWFIFNKGYKIKRWNWSMLSLSLFQLAGDLSHNKEM